MKILPLFLLFQFYITNAVLFINNTGYSYIVLEYCGREVAQIKDCLEVENSKLEGRHILIQLATKEGPYSFYNNIEFNDKISANTIVVFKDSSYKIYHGSQLNIEVNCENKDLILEKIEELEKLSQIKVVVPEENKSSQCHSKAPCILV